MTKDFDVTIIGGGMCGLACAIGLKNAGLTVHVFEAASKFGEVGAGVGLNLNGVRALKGLGLLEAVLTRTQQSEPTPFIFSFLAGAENDEKVFDYIESSGGGRNSEGLGIYRPAYLESLAPLLDPKCIQFNKRCTSVVQLPSGRQLLRFTDDTTHETDLVIGADGIKSVTRNTIVGDAADSLGFSGTYAYRGLIPVDKLKAAGVITRIDERPHCWVGIGKHLVAYPIECGKVLNVVAFHSPENNANLLPERPHPWVQPRPLEELFKGYKDWGGDAMTIIRHLVDPSRWSIHTLYPPLKSFVKGRVVLVGDAAHGMLPHLGAGVGQGLEDVYVLCRLLAHPRTNLSNLNAVLAIYDKLRPTRDNMVLERSLKMGKIYENYGPGHYDIEEMREHLTGMWEPVWDHDLEGEVNLAINEMEKELAIKN